MKKYIVLTVSLLLMGLVISPSWAARRNLLSEAQSDVEIDISDFTAMNATVLSPDTTESWTGASSLRADCAGLSNWEGWSTAVTIPAVEMGKEYTFSVWLKGSGTVAIYLGNTTVFNPVGPFNLTSTWTKYSHSGLVNSSVIYPLVFTFGPQTAFSVYSDGMEVVKGDPTNLLSVAQSDVEAGISDFNAMTGAAISQDTTESWSGASSLRADCPGLATWEGWSTAVTIPAEDFGEEYTFSVYLKGSGTVGIHLGNTVPFGITWVNLTSTWTRYGQGEAANSTVLYPQVFSSSPQAAFSVYSDGMEVAKSSDFPVADAGGPYIAATTALLDIAPDTLNIKSSGRWVTAYLSGATTGNVTLDGSGSSDPYGDPLTYSWDIGNDGVVDATGVSPTVILPVGRYQVTLTVRGGALSDIDSTTITVSPFDVSTINPETFFLNGVPADWGVYDVENDELVVKFDRYDIALTVGHLSGGDAVMTLSDALGTIASDTIAVIDKGVSGKGRDNRGF